MGPDIFYIHAATFKKVKEMLNEKKEITEELCVNLTSGEKHDDEDEMIPVDMRGLGGDYEDVEAMKTKLGFTATCEAFAKAQTHFEEFFDEGEEEEIGEGDDDEAAESSAKKQKTE